MKDANYLNLYHKSRPDMTKIVTVDKAGTLKTTTCKDLDASTVYKKCGYKKDDGKCVARHEWNVDGAFYSVWGKDSPRAGQENKYDLPPPVDTALLGGTLAILKSTDGWEKGNFADLCVPEWEKIYEKLFGGFEDLGSSDTESTDELADVPAEMKTSEGYLKDGFVVDDGDDSGMSLESELSEEEYLSDD